MDPRPLLLAIAVLAGLRAASGLLYPRESPDREVKELNGFWHFRADYSEDRNAGFSEKWYEKPLAKTGETILMPVPSSFNDITQNSSLRDFVGWVWYDRQAWIPRSWLDGNTRIMLLFESAHYNTYVWVNGEPITNHSGGHLPFEREITSLVTADSPNTITVAVNNTLTPHTIPPGTLRFHDGYVVQNLQMDFFNYAGIQRPVKLYTTPKAVHIDDITVVTHLQSDESVLLDYSFMISGDSCTSVNYTVQLSGAENNGEQPPVTENGINVACKDSSCVLAGSLTVNNPNLWWPWTMSDNFGQLYSFQVSVTTGTRVMDVYRQPVGLRTVQVVGNQFLINGKPFYFQGFGKHEDADIRGKGLDYPLMMKDMNLLSWLGANSFRTSHYPYAEELMDLCDKNGIVVIDETPAVGLVESENFDDETLAHHLDVLGELISRDKNRPAVVMWSLANEPRSDMPEAEPYFKSLATKAHSLDPTRPITFACNQAPDNDRANQFMDVVAINRYYGWYEEPSHPKASQDLAAVLDSWYSLHKKPVMVTEWGAGAVAGIHKDPAVMYSEEYQAEIYTATFPILDKYRKLFLVGEMIWNFADFETAQSTGRVDGNKKGVLTRQRQPKLGAWVVRQRYHTLAQGRDFCHSHSFLAVGHKNHCSKWN